MEDWKEYKYTELASLIGGGTPKTSETSYWNGNIPWLSVKDFCGNSKYVYKTEKHITELGLRNSSTKLLHRGDIIISARGTVGEIAMLPRDMAFNQSCFGIRVNAKVINNHYLYYLTKTKVRELQNSSHGSVFDTITKDTFENIHCSIPNINEQIKIAAILSSLDDKIELNRRINDNLEQQAQALFKAWFVDFEPFKDGEFVDSELGMIPKGWRVVCLGEVTKQVTEKVGNREDVTVLSPVNSGELVLSEEYFTKQVFSKNLSKYLIVNPLSFAYNPARINIGSIGLNEYDFVGCVSPVYVVFKCEPNYHYFFDFYKRTAVFKDEVALRAIGGVRQSLGYDDFSLIKTIYPTPDVVAEFNNLYLKMKEVITRNDIQNNKLTTLRDSLLQNNKLTTLRDSLLPKLMSGELKINNFNR